MFDDYKGSVNILKLNKESQKFFKESNIDDIDNMIDNIEKRILEIGVKKTSKELGVPIEVVEDIKKLL